MIKNFATFMKRIATVFPILIYGCDRSSEISHRELLNGIDTTRFGLVVEDSVKTVNRHLNFNLNSAGRVTIRTSGRSKKDVARELVGIAGGDPSNKLLVDSVISNFIQDSLDVEILSVPRETLNEVLMESSGKELLAQFDTIHTENIQIVEYGSIMYPTISGEDSFDLNDVINTPLGGFASIDSNKEAFIKVGNGDYSLRVQVNPEDSSFWSPVRRALKGHPLEERLYGIYGKNWKVAEAIARSAGRDPSRIPSGPYIFDLSSLFGEDKNNEFSNYFLEITDSQPTYTHAASRINIGEGFRPTGKGNIEIAEILEKYNGIDARKLKLGQKIEVPVSEIKDYFEGKISEAYSEAEIIQRNLYEGHSAYNIHRSLINTEESISTDEVYDLVRNHILEQQSKGVKVNFGNRFNHRLWKPIMGDIKEDLGNKRDESGSFKEVQEYALSKYGIRDARTIRKIINA